MPGCPAVLAWLCLQGRANPHATVPLQKRNNHTPSPQYAGIHGMLQMPAVTDHSNDKNQ